MTMDNWLERLHQFLTMTGREILQNAGSMSHELALEKARAEYTTFSAKQAQLPSEVEKHFIETEMRLAQTEKQLKKP